MKAEKIIGILLIAGAIGVFIPYTVLTITFDYPGILRQDVGTVLTKFHNGGSSLILTWWAFAILGLPLLLAYVMIGQLMDKKSIHMRWVTTLGITSGIVQIIGLLRWVFVVPVIANSYVSMDSIASKEAAVLVFKVIHQFGGVILGEHIGQLFTIIWTIMLSIIFIKNSNMPRWISWLGILSASIYLMAQAELFATVVPGFPYWGPAGFIGSTLWLIWLIVLGAFFYRKAVHSDLT